MSLENTSGKTEDAGSPSQPAPQQRPIVSRRVFVLGSFWVGIGLAAAAAVGASLDFMRPRKIIGFGAPVDVPPSVIPSPGADPVKVPEGRFWLENLAPGAADSPGGLLAFYQKCPHLGCTVEYRPDFEFSGRKGWFRCPCHGSTFTKEGGILVWGPSSRDMDTMRIDVKPEGGIIVDSGDITEGGKDNPQRAVPYPGPGAAPAPSETSPTPETPSPPEAPAT
ncbi:MAG: QcrA and Rieske domain-containing protein [Dehalococcoidia bacterium]